jgi:Integrase core domain
LQINRELHVHKSKCGGQADLTHRIMQIAETRVRYGYRRIHVLPTDNAFIERFNSKFRAQCLNAHQFMSLDDARRKMEDWPKDYNEVRPHNAIGNRTPISLINHPGAIAPE